MANQNFPPLCCSSPSEAGADLLDPGDDCISIREFDFARMLARPLLRTRTKVGSSHKETSMRLLSVNNCGQRCYGLDADSAVFVITLCLDPGYNRTGAVLMTKRQV